MSVLDLLLIIILGASVVTGFKAGFARVGIGFCAAVAAVIFGFWLYAIPAGWLRVAIHSQPLANLFGFIIVFTVVVTIGAIVAKLVSLVFKWTGLSGIDRVLGGAFGLVRGAVVAVALVAVLIAFAPRPLPNWIVTSRLLPYAVDGSNLLASLAPADLKDALADGVQEIRKDWDEELKKAQRKKDKPKRLGNKEVI